MEPGIEGMVGVFVTWKKEMMACMHAAWLPFRQLDLDKGSTSIGTLAEALRIDKLVSVADVILPIAW